MSSNAPLVSVAIPARDGRERLLRTLESIGRADVDLERLEVVVADDGSTDGIADALAARRFPFSLIVLRGAWSNQSAATDAAAAACTKHPDHEGGPAVWDAVVASWLAASPGDEERDRAEVACLEGRLRRRDDWRAPWERALVRREPASAFSDAERAALAETDRLFTLYARVLDRPLAQGFVEESLRRNGRKRLAAVLRARLSKLQAPDLVHLPALARLPAREAAGVAG